MIDPQLLNFLVEENFNHGDNEALVQELAARAEILEIDSHLLCLEAGRLLALKQLKINRLVYVGHLVTDGNDWEKAGSPRRLDDLETAEYLATGDLPRE